MMILIVPTVMAQGIDARWPTAAKNGFGTSTTLASKVWFTLADGVMTEVFFPTLDVPNVQMLQLQIATGGRVETETDDTFHRLELPNPSSLTFRQVNSAKSGQYTITKTYITDPRRNTVLIDINFDSKAPAHLSVYYDPSLNNSGLHDSAWTDNEALVAVDGDKASALIANCGFAEVTGRATGNVIHIETQSVHPCAWVRQHGGSGREHGAGFACKRFPSHPT
jgi:glucoamylase